MDEPEVEEEMRDGSIAMSRTALRLVDRLINLERAAGGSAQPAQDVVERVRAVFRVKQRRHGDRAGVDHRVVRPVGARIELDGIEGVTARLHADVRRDPVLSEFLDRHAKREGFGNGLNAERLVGVAAGEGASVGGRDADAEVIGRSFAELGM